MPVLPARSTSRAVRHARTERGGRSRHQRTRGPAAELARRGGIGRAGEAAPVLWNRLRNHTSGIPPAIADRIHAQSAVTEFRMAMTEAVLQDVVRRLAAENIRAMLLKGAALATTVYPSFAARPMGDIDILVRPGEAQRAWQCLVDAGWTVELAGGERFYEGHHHLVGLMDPNGLHLVLEDPSGHASDCRPVPPRRERGVAGRAAPCSWASTTAWVPSDQHQLLHLCIHFGWSNMLFSGLGRTVRDVTSLLEPGTMDWAKFVDLARRTRSSHLRLLDAGDREIVVRGEGTGYGSRRVANARAGGSDSSTRASPCVASALIGACPSIRIDAAALECRDSAGRVRARRRPPLEGR